MDRSTGDSTKRPRRWRRAGVLLLVIGVALELVYLIVGNMVLDSTWLQERINSRPARFKITWSSGSTFFPGRYYLDDVRIVGQSRKNQYAVTFDTGQFSVRTFPLFSQRVHVGSARITGLDVRLRRRLDAVEIPDGKVEHFPPIEGLLNPPAEKPEELYPKRKKRPPWTIAVDECKVTGLRQVWVNGIRLAGDGEVDAAFDMVVRENLGVPRARLVTRDARLSMGQNTIAEHVVMTADVRLDSYPYKEIKGKEMLKQLSTEIRMQGDLHNLAFVDDHGGMQAGVRFGGTGPIEADIQIEQGRFMPGSSYTVDARSLEVGFLDYEFTSSGSIKGKAWTEGEQILGTTEVELANLTGYRISHENRPLTAPSLSFTSVVTDPALAGAEPLRRIEVALPSVSIPEIAMFNDQLPEVLGMKFLHGSAELGAEYAIDAAGAASGTVHLKGSELVAQAQDFEFSGDLSLDGSYRSDDFRAPTYDMSGTKVAISNVFLTDAQRKKDHTGWWFEVLLHEALIAISQGTHIDASAEFSMRDIKPLVALLKEEGKSPKWFGLMPNIKNVEGIVELDLDPSEFDIENMDISGDSLRFLGRLDTDRGTKRAAFYAKYKGIAVGFSLDDSSEKKKKHWTLKKPLLWYQLKRGEVDKAARDPSEHDAETGVDEVLSPAP